MERKLTTPVPGKIGPTAHLYLASLEAEGRALATRYEYWRDLSRLGERYPDKEPDELDTLDLEAFLAVRCHGQSPATRKKALAVLSGYFGYLHDRGKTRSNPTRPIRRPKLPEPEPTFWTGEEVRKILQAPMPARDHLLLEVLARTGQRSGVVRTLTWSQVRLDLQEPEIHFRPGKGGKVHTIPMDRELIHDFTVYKRMTHPGPEDYVFQSRNRHTRGTGATGLNGPISALQVNRIIAKGCRTAGVRVASAHEFRRSCITNLLYAGVPLDVVSRDVAAHGSVVTTIKHYRGTQPERVRNALRGLPY